MPRRRICGKAVLAVLYIATATTAQSIPNLFSRQSSTCAAGFSHCPQPGLPDNFCCPSTTNCIVLAANTTVLCCPKANACAEIAPITCNISAQDASANPQNTLKTTALTGTLEKCGQGCCPFGYSCTGKNTCAINADQSVSPLPQSSLSSSAPPSSVPTSTSIPASTDSSTTDIASSTASSFPNTSSIPSLTGRCPPFPTPAVLVGFFPGLIIGVLLTLLIICLLGLRHQRKTGRRNSGSGSSFGNISSPHLQSEPRTDFLRKIPGTPSTTAAGSTPSRKGTVKRVRSLFRKDAAAEKSSSAPPPPQIPMALNLRGMNARPVTPVAQREPSYENINIFADGDTASALRGDARKAQGGAGVGLGVGGGGGLAPPPMLHGDRGSQQTTFTDMMERSGLAGLQKGQPYVYKGNSPGYSPSPKRGAES